MIRLFAIASLLATFCVTPLFGAASEANEIKVAVATNFLNTAEKIAASYEEETGQTVTLIAGSSGKLAAQIMRGAPFDVFLSADKARPGILIEKGFAEKSSRITYAIGQLVLWSDTARIMSISGDENWKNVVSESEIRSLAIANPALAPYGLAAQQSLERGGFWENGDLKTVVGENVGQAFAMAATGNADAAIVARALVMQSTSGRFWPIPHDQYQPIEQDAVLTSRSAENGAAKAFLAYLTSKPVRTMIVSDGYALALEPASSGD